MRPSGAPIFSVKSKAGSSARRLLEPGASCYGLKPALPHAASNATETSLFTGLLSQPLVPAFFWHPQSTIGKSLRLEASGIFSTTATPTLIFQVRMGTSVGPSSLAGASVGVSSAITTGSGVTNKYWKLVLELTCTVQGLGSGNATLLASGYVMSPGGFASPFIYPLEITTPDTATWTQTYDASW